MIEWLIKLYIVLIPISYHMKKIEIIFLLLLSFLTTVSILAKSLLTKINLKMISQSLGLLGLFILISSFSEISSVIMNFHSSWILESLLSFCRIILTVPIVIYCIIEKIELKKEILIGAIYSSIIALLQLIFPIWINVESRVGAGFSHPNFLAYYLTICLAIVLLDKSLNLKKLTKFLSIIFFVVVVFYTGTRSALVLVILITLVWLFGEIIKYRSTYLYAPFIIGISILLIYLFGGKIKRSISLTRFGLTENNLGSYTWRELRWKSALENRDTDIFHFLFGSGWQSSSYMDNVFYGIPLHNEYIRLYLDTGFLGIASLICFFLYLITKCFKKNKENILFCYSIILIIIVGMYIDNLFISSETLMVLMFLTVYVRRSI